MLNQSKGLQLPAAGRRLLRLSVLRRRDRQEDAGRQGDRNDTDFVNYLLEAEGCR
jgi:hypothetical protein